MKIHTEFDRDGEGNLKVTRSGHYRFSIILAEDGEEGKRGPELVRMRGFRLDARLARIQEPTSVSPVGSVIHHIDLSRTLEDRLLAHFRSNITIDE